MKYNSNLTNCCVYKLNFIQTFKGFTKNTKDVKTVNGPKSSTDKPTKMPSYFYSTVDVVSFRTSLVT